MVGCAKKTGCLIGLMLLAGLSAYGGKLDYLEQLPVASFAKMREVERYQLRMAEKAYLKNEYRVALDEYEKYLTLYERSDAAPYAQLMWSHCQLRLRKVNTAIRDGFQSVIDYWPESHEAVLASFMIGRCYKTMGELGKAERRYRKVEEEHPRHFVAVLAKSDLLDIARIRDDEEMRVGLWKSLVFETGRTKQTEAYTSRAARELAAYHFRQGVFDDAKKVLETHYREGSLAHQVHELGVRAVHVLTGKEESRKAGEKLADRLVAYGEEQLPDDLSEANSQKRGREILFRMANVHHHARRPQQVFAAYERMARLLGADDEILGHMAGWYKGQNRREDARRVYERFQDRIEGRRRIAHMFREEKKYDRAIELYLALMQDDPDRVEAYQWTVAECYQDSKKFKEAINTYRQCDRYPDVYFRMAWCHRQLNQYTQALVLYNQAKSYEHKAAEAQLQIAFTYEKAGQREKAIKSFQITCRNYPKTGEASRAHAHLQDKYKINVTLGGAKEE